MIAQIYAAAWLIISSSSGILQNRQHQITALPMPSMSFCLEQMDTFKKVQFADETYCIAGQDTRRETK